jgi:hypothetical protein
MKRCVLVLVLAVVLILASTISAQADPPKNMVTGSGYWTNTAGPHHMYAEFNAQEAYKGQPAKGHLYLKNLDTGAWLEADVEGVGFEADAAWFWGEVSDAGDGWEIHIGGTWWVLVRDGGQGADEVGGDYFRSGKSGGIPGWIDPPDFANNTAWYGGNVQIH